ncbi:unnamed protein product [Cladocopium goreaui]|uniref:Uncharacterized protein n=1 Tax=Cladocopium goreaui TaxID=2562237 RepID=A0A9P1GFW6_9DINO|nr:unnamed protein product [Cladocopium goreaui]
MEGFTVEDETVPTVSPSVAPKTEGEADGSPQHFDLSAEDPELEADGGYDNRASSFEQAFDRNLPAAAAGGNLEQIRERLQFLSIEDQKTVCRRECQIAQQQHDALQRQLQQTIDRYRRVVQLHGAMTSHAGAGESAVRSECVMDEEVLQKYRERIELLEKMLSTLCSEATVSLPRLTPMERAKGFAFSSYANTAVAANKLKDGTAPVLENARGALVSFASRLRRGSGEGAGGYAGDTPAA